MAAGWKRIDLAGGGLQSANLRLAAVLRRRRVAYGCLVLFPLGLHRSYLGDRRGAWIYRLATLAAAGLFLAGLATAAALIAGVLALLALLDIRWIERRIVAVNKQARMDAWFGQGNDPPPGYRGRFTEDALEEYLEEKEAEISGTRPRRVGSGRPASLAEQERQLAERARRDRNGKP